jgi:hypothetical protein
LVAHNLRARAEGQRPISASTAACTSRSM